MSSIQEYAKKSISLSKEDYFLFGSNITSLAAFALDHLGYHAPLLKTISNVTLLASTLGESLLTTPSCSHLYTALPALTFFGARLFIDHQSQSNPSLKLVSLAINGYGTC